MSAKILIVEDDAFLLENLRRLLLGQGYVVKTASSGEEGLRQIKRESPDLAILDVSLPDFDGLTLCRRVRELHRFPILMLTARSDTFDKVLGLEVGADDYLTKPFDPSELMARVRALLRRTVEYSMTPLSSGRRLVFGDLVIELDAHSVTLGGRPLTFTRREFELLAHLASNSGRVLSRESLFERNWGFDIEFSSNSLDVHIYRIRRKIEPDPARPTYLHTVRGLGYKFGFSPET